MVITPEARTRLLSLYSYLKAVSLRSHPPIKNVGQQEKCWRLGEFPEHESLLVGLSDGRDPWLELKKPETHLCPEPPAALKPWLHDGWDALGTERAKHKAEIIRHDAQGQPIAVAFDQHEAWREWANERALWRQAELPARKCLDLWNDFFAVNTRLKREGESLELVLGNAIFSYKNLHHPILLKRCQLGYEPQTQTFLLSDTETPTELYAGLFADSEFVDLPIKEWSNQLGQSDPHPLGDISHWLKTLGGAFPTAKLLEAEPPGNHDQPRIGPAPMLFLRKRGAGLTQFIDDVLQALPNVETIPKHLLRIVGCYPDASPATEGVTFSDADNAYAGEADDVLLSKEANAAQLAILRRLKHSDGVLVQGPPGTGKTHTIANLLGSLMAEGKSVLVTSHTSKALKVLQHHVSEPLRALCVPVLDSDKKSQKVLQHAMRVLHDGLSQHPDELAQRANQSRARRTAVLNEIRELRGELETAVNGEYQPLLLAGDQYDPVAAAKEVSRGGGIHDWIPGPVVREVPAPLSPEDLAALYASQQVIPAALEHDLAHAIPSPKLVPPVEEYAAGVAEIHQHQAAADYGHRRDLWSGIEMGTEPLEQVIDELIKAMGTIPRSDSEPWRLAIVESVCQGQDGASNVWALLCQSIEAIAETSREAAALLFSHDPVLPDIDDFEAYAANAAEIIAHLSRRNSISAWTLLLKPAWKKMIDSSRVEGRKPIHKTHFEALHARAQLLGARRRLLMRWNQMAQSHGVPAVPATAGEPEMFAGQFVPTIRACLDWHRRYWVDVRQALVAQGLKLADLDQELPVFAHAYPQAARLRHMVTAILPPIVAAEKKRRRVAALEQELESIRQGLSPYANVEVVRQLQTAINGRSVSAYRQAYEALEVLLRLQPKFAQRLQWLAIIRAVAPGWATVIEQRIAPHDSPVVPGKLGDAWRWRQFSQELDRRAALSVADLQSRIERLSVESKRITTEVIKNEAWSGVIRRVDKNPSARAALVAWVMLMNKIGAGTGVQAAALMRQARIEMEKARPCVPVWIMPFSRLIENFSPVRNPFDVIIVDEASQENPLGLAPFFMGKKVIVVGDDEQVTPLDVGGAVAPVQDLIQQWLGDLPAPGLFDLKSSIYDRAKIAFGQIIQLTEHFRCVPEIIQFSNDLSYDGQIKPLRDSASTAIKPAVVPHRVAGIRKGMSNEIEAREIVSLIAAMNELPEYAAKTIGVITLLGGEKDQVKTIDWLMQEKIDAVTLERRRILCGTPAQFQGDERDVIFHSMIDSNEGDGPLVMKGDGHGDLNKKRYNVAASRAKDQLWVVHSLDHQAALKPGDLRRRLIEHARNPGYLMKKLEHAAAKTESPFEKEVLERLVRHGYKVSPQWKVGAYRIDLVVEGDSGAKLAVECDGDRWHYDKVAEDLARQTLLERLGWKFVRIRGSVFYRNRDEAMQPVFAKLADLGILPADLGPIIPSQSEGDSLRDRVIRRAAELRREWGWDSVVAVAGGQ